MKEITTKEQLQIELVKLKESHASWVNGDERRRKEFAKVFKWEKPTPFFSEDRDVVLPSWEQIFANVGKLLAARSFYNFEGNLSELECKIEKLEQNINKQRSENK